MLIGPGVIQLEQRITDALCSGSLHLKELKFLQNISRKIELYRERAFLSPSQAGWLFTILTNFEKGTTKSPSKVQRPPGLTKGASPHSPSKNASESPELMKSLAGLDGYTWTVEEPQKGFDISEAFEPDGAI